MKLNELIKELNLKKEEWKIAYENLMKGIEKELSSFIGIEFKYCNTYEGYNGFMFDVFYSKDKETEENIYIDYVKDTNDWYFDDQTPNQKYTDKINKWIEKMEE